MAGCCVALAAASGFDAARRYFLGQEGRIAPAMLAGNPQLRLHSMEARLSDPAFVTAHADEIASIARASLRQEPLSPAALRNLALVSSDHVQPLLQLAAQVSRRDLPSQLGLIEVAVQQGDIAQALAHYDAALSVHPRISATLYERLAVAIEDKPVRDALLPYVGRPWFADFIGFAVHARTNLAAVAHMLNQARPGLLLSDQERLSSLLLQAFVAQGEYGSARSYLLTLPGAGSQLLYDMGFQVSDPRFLPVSWVLNNDIDSRAEVDPAGVLKLELSSGKLKQVAARVTYWAPGSYELIQKVGYEATAAPAHLRWQVDCLTPGQSGPVWQQSVPVQDGEVTYRSVIHIPANCGTQRWILSAQGDEAQLASLVQVQLTGFTKATARP